MKSQPIDPILKFNSPIPTGLVELDNLLENGLKKGAILTIIGKSIERNSALATNLAYSFTRAHWHNYYCDHKKVLYVSFRDCYSKLMVNIASEQTSYTRRHILNSWISNKEAENLANINKCGLDFESTGIRPDELFFETIKGKIGEKFAVGHLRNVADFLDFILTLDIEIVGTESDLVRSLMNQDFLENESECFDIFEQFFDTDAEVILIDSFHMISSSKTIQLAFLEKVLTMFQKWVADKEKLLVLVPQFNGLENEEMLSRKLEQFSNYLLRLDEAFPANDSSEIGEFIPVLLKNNSNNQIRQSKLRYISQIERFINESHTEKFKTDLGRFGYWNVYYFPIKSEVYANLSGKNDELTDLQVESILNHQKISDG